MAKRGENIYKRKDGRYEGRYVKGRDANGRTRFGYIYGYQYAEVQRRLLIQKAQLLQNYVEGHSRSISLEHWVCRWLEGEIQNRVKNSSYQTYLNLFRRHIQPVLGGVLLSRVTTEDVRDLLAGLHKRLAPATVRSVLRLLNAALASAVEEGYIQRNPCARITLSAYAAPEQRVLSRREQERLRSACLASGNVAVLLGLYCGLRLGEVCALQWADVDRERKTLTIRRTVQRTTQPGGQARTALNVGTPKTIHSRRTIPVPDFLLKQLAEPADASPWIFGCTGPAEPRTLQRRLASLAEELGMENVHFHTLRHTFATRLMELGVDVKTVSVLLGHSSTRITLDFYAHSLQEQQRIAVDRLAEQ